MPRGLSDGSTGHLWTSRASQWTSPVLHQVPKKVKVWFSSTSKPANTTPYPSSSAFYWHLWFLASSRSPSPAISFFGMFGTSTTSVWPNSRDTVGFPPTAPSMMPLSSTIRLIKPFTSGPCKSFAFNWKTRVTRGCNSVWRNGIGFLDVPSLKTFPKAYSWVNARFSFWLDDTSRAAASGQRFIWPTSDSWMKGMMLSYWYSWRKYLVIPSTSDWERGCIKNQFSSGRGTLKRRGTSGSVSEVSWQTGSQQYNKLFQETLWLGHTPWTGWRIWSFKALFLHLKASSSKPPLM